MTATDAHPVSDSELISSGFLPLEHAEVRHLRRRLAAIAAYADERVTDPGSKDPTVAFRAISSAARAAVAEH